MAKLDQEFKLNIDVNEKVKNKILDELQRQKKQIDKLEERIGVFDKEFTEINSKIKSLHELIFKTKALCDIQQEQIEELQTEIAMLRNALSDVTLIVAHLSKKDETKG